MKLKPVEYHASEDPDFTCYACGRAVKRAVTLSNGRTFGMDCAAREMGLPRSRSTYQDLEIQARTATGRAAGLAYDERHPRPPRRDGWAATVAWGEKKAAASPFTGVEHFAFMDT